MQAFVAVVDAGSFVRAANALDCVFRPIVTTRSGIVTADFGVVTGWSGIVTDLAWGGTPGCV